MSARSRSWISARRNWRRSTSMRSTSASTSGRSRAPIGGRDCFRRRHSFASIEEAMTEHIPVTKNEDEELPVPTAWRKPLADIVACLASGEFSKLPSVAPVIPLTDQKCLDIESYIRAYGRKLTSLPEESWKTSIYLWMGGYWDVLVDLFTVEEGPSDLVLSLRVY